MQTYDAILEDAFRGFAPECDRGEHSSRIRGNLLMALSNKHGSLLLTTGNKSEMSVGYCTLYRRHEWRSGGDRRPAEDDVYRFREWRNRAGRHSGSDFSPRRLRPNYVRTRRIKTARPPYDVLDQILELHVGAVPVGGGIIARASTKPTVRRSYGWFALRNSSENKPPRSEGDLARVRHWLANADCTTGIERMKLSIIGLGKLAPPWLR